MIEVLNINIAYIVHDCMDKRVFCLKTVRKIPRKWQCISCFNKLQSFRMHFWSTEILLEAEGIKIYGLSVIFKLHYECNEGRLGCLHPENVK